MRCLPIRLFFAAFYFVALFFFCLLFCRHFFLLRIRLLFRYFFGRCFFQPFFLAFFIWRFFSRDFFYCFWTELFFRTNRTDFFLCIVFGRDFFSARIRLFDGVFFGLFPNAIFFRWHLLFSHEFFFCRTDNGNILNFLSSRGKEEIQRDEDSKRRPIKHMYYYDYLIIRITYRFA